MDRIQSFRLLIASSVLLLAGCTTDAPAPADSPDAGADAPLATPDAGARAPLGTPDAGTLAPTDGLWLAYNFTGTADPTNTAGRR